jgi:hypothetical protein
MKLTKRDYDGARAKVAKAGLTERQLNALEDMIIRDSIEKAERDATTTNGVVTHRLGGVGSLLSIREAKESLRVAVYWFHELKSQRVPLPKARQYNQYKFFSNWRPSA